jgi:hypothetical protein
MTDRPDTEQETTTKAKAFAQAALEPTVVIAAVGFALLIVKVTRVSHLNARTSHGLVEGVGPLSVILGTLVGHLPAILFISCVLAIWWAVGTYVRLGDFTSGHALVAAVCTMAVLLLPWPYLIVLVVVGALRWVRSRGALHDVDPRGRHYYWLVGVVAVLLVIDAEVWLPSETFTLQDGNAFVGYELTDSAGWVVLLTEADRMIIRVHEDDVVGRDPCRLREADYELANFPSLLQVVTGEGAQLPEPVCDS